MFTRIGQKAQTICSQVLTVSITQAGGAPPVPPGTVSYNAGEPTAGVGRISTTAGAPYKITMAGYNAIGSAIQAIPTLGGPLPGAGAGPVNAAASTWGPTQIMVPKGQYLTFGAVSMQQAGALAVPVGGAASVVNVQ